MLYGYNLNQHCEECHLRKGKEEIIDKCNVCDKGWKDCNCKCREHGEAVNCLSGHQEECHWITEQEYIIYQGKTITFQTLVKEGVYGVSDEYSRKCFCHSYLQ